MRMIQNVPAAKYLKQSKEEIVRTWEERARQAVPAARAAGSLVLRNSLPEMIENLSNIVAGMDLNADLIRAGLIGQEHGAQRAEQIQYTPGQVVTEYRVLREVLFDLLERQGALSPGVRDIVLNSIDLAILRAIQRFSEDRSKDMERSNRDLEHFAAIAAHDLKSPLATILGFVDLLSQSLGDEIGSEDQRSLVTVKRTATGMSLLIDRLLDYASVGRTIEPFESVCLTEVVARVVENLKSSVEKSGAKIHVGELPRVKGDPSLLAQAFQNLISNALKFKGGKNLEIRISAARQGDRWIIGVCDNGLGFDSAQSETIFSLFNRVEKSHCHEGAGIGLATVRKVAELHGGKVWAESRPNRGASFFVSLPAGEVAPVLH